MLTSRFRLFGLFAVLLALMAQLGAGVAVPAVDPVAVAGVLCHADDGAPPGHGPTHSSDCLTCPLCTAIHAQQPALASAGPELVPPPVPAVRRAELPPPSTAPPTLRRSPSQPRAPPTVS